MIGGLQMLRGVAATLVVLFHLQAASVAEGHDPGVLRWFLGGEVGVDVFFVLSGFVIFHAMLGRTDRGATGFCARASGGSFPLLGCAQADLAGAGGQGLHDR